MVTSMTGFATATGSEGAYAWVWDLRSVNARGLDLRLRLPDGVPGLEPELRSRLAADLTRGNVTVSLKLQRDDGAGTLEVDHDCLRAVLRSLQEIQTEAQNSDLELATPTTLDVMNFRGVLSSPDRAETPQDKDLLASLLSSFDGVLQALVQMRRAEGDALSAVLDRQLATTAQLIEQARHAADARQSSAAERLRDSIRLILETADLADEARLAQELALLAVKADITEEIDRLEAHVAAARTLLENDAPIGRKLDFLMQEFNREANTLCSKAGSTDLTRTGLDLKAVIDQMREQVQNVE